MLSAENEGTMTARNFPKTKVAGNATLARTLPFLLFMAFIALNEGARFMVKNGLLTLDPTALYYLYPVRTFLVALLLFHYRGEYHELCWKDLAKYRITAAATLIGLVTCVMWVYTDWMLSVTGPPPGFNPTLLPEGAVRLLMTITRVAGAVLLVPVMEELFWRSFMMRYFIDTDFEAVPLGRFTWFSFIGTAILFGLEHHLFLAGVAAGVIYNLILCRTRSLAQCVLAHAVTNLALAVYVLYTGQWGFW